MPTVSLFSSLPSRGRPIARLALAAVLFAGAAGCEVAVGPTDPWIGVYTLVTVNDFALPVTVEESTGFRREITAGMISLNADGTFSDRLTRRETTGTATVVSGDTIVGLYSRSGDIITFASARDDSHWNGTLSSTSIVEIIDGVALHYSR